MDCRYCKYTQRKETKKSQLQYGWCKFIKMAMISIQNKCKYFVKMDA